MRNHIVHLYECPSRIRLLRSKADVVATVHDIPASVAAIRAAYINPASGLDGSAYIRLPIRPAR